MKCPADTCGIQANMEGDEDDVEANDWLSQLVALSAKDLEIYVSGFVLLKVMI